MCLSTILDIIALGLLLITLIVLSIYTYQTYRLRKETVKQTELSLRPYVILTPAISGRRLNFENIGHSHAIDVSIDILHYLNAFIVRHNPHHLVRKSQKVGVGFVLVGENEEAEEMVNASPDHLGYPFFAHLENKEDYLLTVRYKNIEGTPYYTRLEVRVHERRVIIKKFHKDKEPRS